MDSICAAAVVAVSIFRDRIAGTPRVAGTPAQETGSIGNAIGNALDAIAAGRGVLGRRHIERLDGDAVAHSERRGKADSV